MPGHWSWCPIIYKKMKVKVLKRFRDKHDHVTRYEVGAEQEFETERAADLIKRSLAEAVEETSPDDEPKGGDDVAEPETEQPSKVDEPVKPEKPAKAVKADKSTKVEETAKTEEVKPENGK